MGLSVRIRNAVRGLLQTHGTEAVKRRLWDAEFSTGRWSCLEATPGDCVYGFIEKYALRGSILDLGCGSGSTGNEIAFDSYHDYTGIDISEVALGKAREKSERSGRGGKNRFMRSDVESYVADKVFDVVLFRDTIYYIPHAHIHALLDRYAACLKPDGVFVVRMWDGKCKHQNIVALIENQFDVIEKHSPDDSTAMVLVFRPPAGSHGDRVEN